MAYDQARYNLTAYNLGSGEVLYLSADGLESVRPNLSVAVEQHLLAIGYESVDSAISPTRMFWLETEGAEDVVLSESDIRGDLAFSLDFEETVTGSAAPSSIIYLSVNGEESVSLTTLIPAEIIYMKIAGEEAVTNAAAPSPDVHLTAEGYEYVAETANLEALDFVISNIEITLAPGDRLVVDASNYVVLLNGNNAIESHSGDWIDELTRESVEITVGAAGGAANLSASILYTERYL